MAFEGLTEKISSTFKKLRGKGRLKEADVKEAMRDIRMALLEADVSYKVVKDFTKSVTERCVGADVLESLTPAQMIVKIVNEELCKLMGNETKHLNINPNGPTVVMLVGLQGAGKTTNGSKLAGLMKRQGRNPLLVACDVYRPAAIQQLKVCGEKLGIPVFEKGTQDPVVTAKEAVLYARQRGYDMVFLDTAGRLHVDEALMEELKNITMAFHDNGMAMEVDVKRVNINLENLKVQHDNAQAMMEQQLNLLKYIIDYPAEENIALVPVNTEMITPAALTGLSETLYELQLLQSQKQLAEQQKTIVSNGYIPSLSLTGSWMFSAYTDKAYHWFHSGPSNHWYRSYGVGLSLRIPIFDGLDKRYKMRKATIDIENIKLAQENTRKNLQTQYLNATNDLMNSQRNFKKQKDNYLLAEDVYTVTMDRYREGIASMTEVLQDEMRMSEAQNNYISAHYNYRITNLTLLKLTGQLETLSPSIH